MDEKFISERITELRLKKDVSEYPISSGRSLPSMSQFYEICRYFEITPQEFFDERLHDLPLYQKANELLKQLDEDDMLAILSILKRLTEKHS